MALERPRNRWVIAVAAVVMQICLGAAYGWSVFVRPLMGMTGWTLTQVSLNFTLAIAFLGVGTIIGGLWQDRVGPRLVATVAGVLCGLSYLLAGYFAAQHSLWGLYFSYGMLGGIGMGMGYITPVATLTKWFPDRRGLMTGVAVAGYGAGALIMSPMGGIYGWILLAWGLGAIPSPILIARLRQTTGRYDQAIYILGVVLLVSAVLPLLAKPPGRPVPARFGGSPVRAPGDRTEA